MVIPVSKRKQVGEEHTDQGGGQSLSVPGLAWDSG